MGQIQPKPMPQESNTQISIVDDNDEPDEWDQRIFSTGCATEQTKMNDCYFEKKDWRICSKEMEAFRACWKKNGNDQRTATKDVDT